MNSLVDSGLHRIIFVSNKVNTDQKRSNCDLCIKGKNHYHCALCSKEFPLRRVEYFKRHLDWHDEQKGTAEEQARNLFKITSRNEKCAVNDCIELLRHYHCPGCLRIFKRRDQFMDYHAARCGEFNSLRRKDRHGQELFIEGLDRYEEEQETQVTVEEQEAVGFSATDQEHGLADKVLINEGDNALDVNRGKSKKFKLEHDDIENYQDTLEMGSNNGNFGFEGTGKNKTDLDESIHIDSKSDTASRICRSIDIRLNRIIFVSNSVNLKSRKDDCESCVKGKGHYHCSLCSKGFHKRREEYFIKHLNWHDAGGDLDKELEKSDCDAEGCHLTYVHFHCPGCSKVYKQNGQCMDNHVNRCQKLQGDASMSPCGTPSMSINSDTESNGIDNLVIENTYETTTNQNEVDSTPSGSIITLSERNAAIESVMCTSSRTVSSTMSVVDVGLKTALSSFPWTTTTPPSSSTPEVRVRSGLNRIAFVSPKNAEEFRADCDLCIENENHYHCTLCPKTFAKRREEYFVKHLERHDKGNITACKAEIIGCIVMQKHYHCPFCKELCVEDDNHYQCTFCSKTFGKWHSEEIEPATAWQIEEADPTTTQQLDKADPTTTCMLGIPGCPMTQNHIHCQGCKKPVECDPRQSGIVEHSKVCEKFKSLVKNTQVSHVNFIDKFISAIGHNYQISCSVSSGTVVSIIRCTYSVC